MSKNAENGAVKTAPKGKKKTKKPLRRAHGWGKLVPGLAGRLLIVFIAVSVIGVIFSALQAIESDMLRGSLSFALAAVMLALYFSEGQCVGANDASASRFYEKMTARGNKLDAKEDAACYQPLKAVCAAAAVFAIPLLLAVFVALGTEDYTYTMQDLPLWVSESYAARQDVMGALGSYTQVTHLTALDVSRVVVRLVCMTFVNFFGDPLRSGAMIDRLCPAAVLLYGAAYVIGYLTGPMIYEKGRKQERRAKKVAARRAQKSSLAQELVGSGGEVHYGQQVKDEKRKKKELI